MDKRCHVSDHDSTPQEDAGRVGWTIAACCLLASLAPILATGQTRDQSRLRLEELAVAENRLQRLEAGVGEWGFTLDFETGDLRGWEASGTAFRCQPTLGDNPRARDRESSNHQGRYWVGTFECYQGGSRSPGEVQGDGAQGTLTSRAFTAEAGSLSFLVAGGEAYETRVELRRLDPIEGANRVLYATGSNSESMRRVYWDLTPWAGSSVQLHVVDASSGGWGHINVDDIQFTPARAAQPPREDLVPVPELRRGDLSSARELLGSRRLQLGRIESVPAAAEVGSIVAQDPEPGREVPFGSSVDVVLARGVEVPRLVDRDWRDARRQLEERRLVEGRIRETPSAEAVGTVLAQDPPPGREVPLETPVALEIAVGVPVPDLRRRLLPEAERLLQRSGLQLGRIVPIPSPEAADSVIRQSPTAATRVPLGSFVDLEVAQPTETPEPGRPQPPPTPEPSAPGPSRPGPSRPDPQGTGPGRPEPVRPEPARPQPTGTRAAGRLDPMLLVAGLVLLVVGALLWRALRLPADGKQGGEPQPLSRVVAHQDPGRQDLELDGDELIAPEVRLRGRRGDFESTLEIDGPLV